jgi:hypothetical protein
MQAHKLNRLHEAGRLSLQAMHKLDRLREPEGEE